MDSRGIIATYIGSNKFSVEGNATDIFVIGRNIKADCGEDDFQYGKITSSSWITSGGGLTKVELDSDHLTSNLDLVWYEDAPYMEDGRPIVRADTRPLDTMILFTATGDDESIGDGVSLRWDFSNDDDLYTGDEVPDGYKAKQILLTFNCPIYLKDGSIYFFDAPWGQYINMDILVPSGGFYDHPQGPYPAAALGLSGDKKYAQAPSDSNVVYQRYVHKHSVYGDCPMGDELNAEGCAISAIPIGWFVRGLIITPVSDNVSKGYGSLEMYRCHTNLLPGQTIADIH